MALASFLKCPFVLYGVINVGRTYTLYVGGIHGSIAGSWQLEFPSNKYFKAALLSVNQEYPLPPVIPRTRGLDHRPPPPAPNWIVWITILFPLLTLSVLGLLWTKGGSLPFHIGQLNKPLIEFKQKLYNCTSLVGFPTILYPACSSFPASTSYMRIT